MKRLLAGLTRLLVPEYRPKHAPSRLVAVVVPVSNHPVLTPDEETSMRHLQRHLGRYDKYLVAPRGLHFNFEGFQQIHLSPNYFGSMRAHNRMLYSPGFFKLFRDYKYILLYHLDALVFSDELVKWCETNVDYIGAPWIPSPDCPWVKEPRVGNGGFALYKVESVIKALHNRYRMDPGQFWEERLLPLYQILQPFLKRWQKPAEDARALNFFTRKIRRMDRAVEYLANSDLFFGMEAEKFHPEFRVADWQTGLRFAFETDPRRCLELNGGKLPFGCHAWARYDRAFWEPFLLQEPAEN